MGVGESKAVPKYTEYLSAKELSEMENLFHEISEGEKTFSSGQFQMYYEGKIQLNITNAIYKNLFCPRLETSTAGVTKEVFLECLALLLKGNVVEKSQILVSLAAESSEANVNYKHLQTFVFNLVVSYCQTSLNYQRQHHLNFHCPKEAVDRLCTVLLEDFPHAGVSSADDSSSGPAVTAEAVEIWLSKAALFSHIFQSVFKGCFTLGCKDEDEQASHQFSIPSLLDVSGQPTDTCLDLPSVLFINSSLALEYRHCWQLLFSNRIHGNSFTQLLSKILMKGPNVLIVQDADGHCFGGFASQSWEKNSTFYGSVGCCLFLLKPHFGVYFPTGYNSNFMYLNHGCQTLPNGLGMGGQLNYFGLWIDQTFSVGHSRAVPICSTYDSPQLSAQAEFQVSLVEVWAVGKDTQASSVSGQNKKSVLDTDPGARAILDLMGKAQHSYGIREPDS